VIEPPGVAPPDIAAGSSATKAHDRAGSSNSDPLALVAAVGRRPRLANRSRRESCGLPHRPRRSSGQDRCTTANGWYSPR
jgi:hypothetical protein